MLDETADLMAFVPVIDVARARAFYEGNLGLTVRSGDDYGCMLESRGTILRFARVEEFERPPHTILGWSVRTIAEAVVSLSGSGVVR